MNPATDKHLLRFRVIDSLRGTDALKYYDEYLRSQWLPASQIKEMQLGQLQRLLSHAYTNCGYYRKVFDDLKMGPGDFRSLDDLRRLPLLTKELIRANRNGLEARNKDVFRPLKKSTGGSTGDPLSFLMDRLSYSSQWATVYRQWNTGGWHFGDPLVYFFGGASVFSPSRSVKKWMYARLNKWLVFSSFGINDARLDRWLRHIRRRKIRFMHAYASSAYSLARFALEHGVRDIAFTSVFTSAEPLYPIQRETIQEAFRCEVFDLYGANDGGGYAFECGAHDGLHYVGERAVIEVLKDDGAPAREGESGEVVSTDLLNYAMPFIRYKVGDIATAGSPACACGRQTPKLKEVKGKSHDFVTTLAGERVHGAYFCHVVRRIDWVVQFQVIQRRRDSLGVVLKPSKNPRNDGLEELEKRLRRKFPGMKIDITVAYDIPLSPHGKFRFIINKAIEENDKS